MENLEELSKPEEIVNLQKDLKKYGTVDTRETGWKGNVIDVFNKHGFKMIGSGKYGLVFSHPNNSSYVVKFFMKDAAFLRWWKFSIANKMNPYVPKFKGMITKVTDNFYSVRMETLSPIWKSRIAEEDYRKFMDGFDAYPAKIPADKNVLAVYEFMYKNKNLLDIHSENVMARGDQLVVLDPLYNFFKANYTIDPNDFDWKNI